jgi:hypothetical protein
MFNMLEGIATRLRMKRVMCKYDENHSKSCDVLVYERVLPYLTQFRSFTITCLAK